MEGKEDIIIYIFDVSFTLFELLKKNMISAKMSKRWKTLVILWPVNSTKIEVEKGFPILLRKY